MICINDPKKEYILVISENGFVKRSNLSHNRKTNQGIKTINITSKTGCLVAIKNVVNKDDIIIINQSGFTSGLIQAKPNKRKPNKRKQSQVK